jgi:hypothetical protein
MEILSFATIRTGRVMVASRVVETTKSTRAGDDLCTRPRPGAGLDDHQLKG